MRMYPKDRVGYVEGINKVGFNPSGENTYDVRGQQDDVYIGGWFSGGWFPADIWWGEGNIT